MALVCLAIHKAGWPEETPKTQAFQQETAVPLFEMPDVGKHSAGQHNNLGPHSSPSQPKPRDPPTVLHSIGIQLVGGSTGDVIKKAILPSRTQHLICNLRQG